MYVIMVTCMTVLVIVSMFMSELTFMLMSMILCCFVFVVIPIVGMSVVVLFFMRVMMTAALTCWMLFCKQIFCFIVM